METIRAPYRITDNRDEMNLDYIVSSLHTTYWAADRPESIIRGSFEASTVLSLLKGEEPAGFARLVGDGYTVCWLCDVFIDPAARGQGLGKFLMDTIMNHPMTQVRLKILLTKDAHGLYERYGFERCEAMTLRAGGY